MPFFPDWASWNYDAWYLPRDFHTTAGMRQLTAGMSDFDQSTKVYGELEYAALAAGMAIKDIDAKQTAGDDAILPSWIASSPLGERKIANLLRFCMDIEHYPNEPPPTLKPRSESHF
jgi:hypothetical protein